MRSSPLFVLWNSRKSEYFALERRIAMSVLESIISAVFCMVVVFVVLTCLYFLIKLFSAGIRKIEAAGRKSTE